MSDGINTTIARSLTPEGLRALVESLECELVGDASAFPGNGGLMTGEQIATSLKARFRYPGEMTQWARDHGINAGQVSASARTGVIQRRVADALGLKRVVMYRREMP